MNRNKDCNEEIHQVEFNTSDRHLYANDPNAALQNIDYKDWLAMSQQYSENPDNSEVNSNSAIFTGIGITGTLLGGFATGPLGTAFGAIICSFATLGSYLWPDKGNPKRVWQDFMNNGEKFQPLDDDVREESAKHLVGFQHLLMSYERVFEDWKDEKDEKKRKALARLVFTRFEDANAAFIKSMPQLQKENYKIGLLSTYAQAANLHLNLLHQGIQFADQWHADVPFSPRTSNTYYKELLQYMEEYIDYCTETYSKGLNKLKNDPNIKWDIYNTYRREMTLIVLDLIALFPNYDVDKFPIRTRTQLTREIYDAPWNDRIKGLTSVEECERLLTRRPHLFTWFEGVNLFTKKVHSYGSPYLGNYLAKISNLCTYTNNSDFIPGTEEENPAEGNGHIHLFPNVFIDRLLISRKFDAERLPPGFFDKYLNGIKSIDVIVDKQGVQKYVNNYQAGGDNPNYREWTEFDLKDHSLSHMLMMSKWSLLSKRDYHQYSFAWTHNSVDFRNNIAKNNITQIPAVKAKYENKDFSVIKGPGHTGGDLVKLSGLSEEGLHIKCSVQVTKDYRIRIRYAANTDTKLRVAVQYESGANSSYLDVEKTYSGDTENYVKYSSFQYADFENEMSGREGEFVTIIIQNDLPDTFILLDKIEFIPISD